MSKILKLYKSDCPIYFYFGVFIHQTSEFNLIRRVFDYFCKNLQIRTPTIMNNFHLFEKIIRYYEENESDSKRFKITDCLDFEFYEKIFDCYNIYFKNEIIEKIKSSSDCELLDALRDLNAVELFDTCKLKTDAHFLIFILTRSYYDSKFFEKHLKEANEMNKKVLFIITEDVMIEECHQNYPKFEFKELYWSIYDKLIIDTNFCNFLDDLYQHVPVSILYLILNHDLYLFFLIENHIKFYQSGLCILSKM